MKKPIVTDHGSLRARKRLGLSKKAVINQTSRVLARGLDRQVFTGSFRKYLDHEANRHGQTPIVYGGSIYIFSGKRLITVFLVPPKHRKDALYQTKIIKDNL